MKAATSSSRYPVLAPATKFIVNKELELLGSAKSGFVAYLTMQLLSHCFLYSAHLNC